MPGSLPRRKKPSLRLDTSRAIFGQNLLRTNSPSYSTFVPPTTHHGSPRIYYSLARNTPGFGGLTFALDGYVRADPSTQRLRTALTYHDKLIRLAEALGVLPLEHAEHGRRGENLYADVDAVLTAIERELNISLEPPIGAVRVTELRTRKGVFQYRHLNAIYAARLIAGFLPHDAAVCQIRRRTRCARSVRAKNEPLRLHPFRHSDHKSVCGHDHPGAVVRRRITRGWGAGPRPSQPV
jgi:hypothetical protein